MFVKLLRFRIPDSLRWLTYFLCCGKTPSSFVVVVLGGIQQKDERLNSTIKPESLFDYDGKLTEEDAGPWTCDVKVDG